MIPKNRIIGFVFIRYTDMNFMSVYLESIREGLKRETSKQLK
jgi:hypothetical protein